MVFLTSDTHAGHVNVINFCKRPFATVAEMNQAMIDRWNSVVCPDDDVYHLGDFAFGPAVVREFAAALNGRIHLCLGNHDYKNIVKPKLQHLFCEVAHAYVIEYQGVKCYLSHYPYLCWMGRYRFDPQFHGHVHLRKGYDGLDLPPMRDMAHPMQYDVGVDLNNFTPISLPDAISRVRLQRSTGKNCYTMWCQEKQ
ncbi:MAG: metallophosphatase [Bacteroidales bacterium]|nr:metallophosphatase [Bacteroidales bacterium]